jgi:hypothetical protein
MYKLNFFVSVAFHVPVNRTVGVESILNLSEILSSTGLKLSRKRLHVIYDEIKSRLRSGTLVATRCPMGGGGKKKKLVFILMWNLVKNANLKQ